MVFGSAFAADTAMLRPSRDLSCVIKHLGVFVGVVFDLGCFIGKVGFSLQQCMLKPLTILLSFHASCHISSSPLR